MSEINHPVSLRIDETTLTQIKAHKGDIPLSQWLKSAIQLKLSTRPVSGFSSNLPNDTDARINALEKRVQALETP
ncbi:hypothetical protein [Vibrio fluvialis]|uniref:hypothetical protein n=1 Tax=Vibrio fluvialis TaxID=676 RepID=UPI0028F6EA31|nr:hypothetical protein [Vibrio fluvialis]